MKYWILPILIVTTLSFNNSKELTPSNPELDNMWSIVTSKQNNLTSSVKEHVEKSIKRHKSELSNSVQKL